MCGIAGCWLPDSLFSTEAVARVEHACSALAHRGPDDTGIWVDARSGIVLGHRRLAILDLSPSGRQPMWSASGHCCVAFNGEIYNFVELREQLHSRGLEFRGTSDTEVLVTGIEVDGVDFLRALRGMFAFAIWDARVGRLLLARDRVGKKPLYYSVGPTGIYFASELEALRVLLPDSNPELRDTALDEYLACGAILGEKTIYSNVCSLLPASYKVFCSPTSPELEHTRYWHVDWTRSRKVDFGEAVDETERLLGEAVKLRLRSDVKVGVLLSGGIDSGLVTSFAAREHGSLDTFCIGFPESSHDERLLAKSVASRYGTNHHEILIADDIVDILPRILCAYGEPFADDSAVPSWYIAKYASTHTKVVLNGDGGDELFCGYRRHRAALLIDTVRRFCSGTGSQLGARVLLALLPQPRRHRTRYSFLHRWLRVLAESPKDAAVVLTSDGFSRKERQQLYSPDRKSPVLVEPFAAHLEKMGGLRAPSTLETLLSLDFESGLPDALLVKMDIASMAHGLEARSPFLDQEVVAWAFSIPHRVRLHGSCTKPLLRELARRHLPERVVRAPKRGFELPLTRWLQSDLAPFCNDYLRRRDGIIAERLNGSSINALLDGPQKAGMEPGRWSRLVWTLLVLAVWDQHRSRNPSPGPDRSRCASTPVSVSSTTRPTNLA